MIPMEEQFRKPPPEDKPHEAWKKRTKELRGLAQNYEPTREELSVGDMLIWAYGLSVVDEPLLTYIRKEVAFHLKPAVLVEGAPDSAKEEAEKQVQYRHRLMARFLGTISQLQDSGFTIVKESEQ